MQFVVDYLLTVHSEFRLKPFEIVILEKLNFLFLMRKRPLIIQPLKERIEKLSLVALDL